MTSIEPARRADPGATYDIGVGDDTPTPHPGTGSVTHDRPPSFAAKCAATMHEREPDALTEAEVRDGWGELVNMVGGGGLLQPRN